MRFSLVSFAGLARNLFPRASRAKQSVAPLPIPTPRPRMRDWRSPTELPDDKAIPAFRAIATSGVRGAFPFLHLDGDAVEVTLRGYAAGKRATLEVRSPGVRVAVKAYDAPPDEEARLYATLEGGRGGVRVPRLLGYDRDLRVLALEWLEGPTLQTLIKDGHGRRAGELATTWLRVAAGLDVRLGAGYGVGRLMDKARKYASRLAAADRWLGTVSGNLVRRLESTQPASGASHLVHGSCYDRHVLDTVAGPGLIDWDCFGQGAIELDAAVFLAVVWRSGLLPERRASSRQAAEAFLDGTAGLFDEHVLAWHRAVAMLRFAHKKIRQRDDHALESARTLLAEAVRLAEVRGDGRGV